MPAPRRLSHIVLRTANIDAMVDWYLTLTGSRIVFRNELACFLSYDEEHHRIGFIRDDSLKPEAKATGLEHVSFAFDELAELLEAYVYLKDRDVRPFMVLNHGPTISFYYEDPEKNHVELMVDNFKRPQDAHLFVESESFRLNPRGFDIDPDLLLRRFREGVPLGTLQSYQQLA